jgi:hypothetical protein
VDESLLPAVYLYVGCSFGATPAQLGSITFVRSVVQALASPQGGILGELVSWFMRHDYAVMLPLYNFTVL